MIHELRFHFASTTLRLHPPAVHSHHTGPPGATERSGVQKAPNHRRFHSYSSLSSSMPVRMRATRSRKSKIIRSSILEISHRYQDRPPSQDYPCPSAWSAPTSSPVARHIPPPVPSDYRPLKPRLVGIVIPGRHHRLLFRSGYEVTTRTP